MGIIFRKIQKIFFRKPEILDFYDSTYWKRPFFNSIRICMKVDEEEGEWVYCCDACLAEQKGGWGLNPGNLIKKNGKSRVLTVKVLQETPASMQNFPG